MAPEFAPVVVTLNSRVEDGQLKGVLEYVESKELPKKLRIRWSVEGQPDDYSAVGGGVAFVYHRDFGFQVIPGSEDARAITLGNDRYLWTEGLQFGVSELMFILILPQGYTFTDPSPLPVGTKIFEDRLALYWILRGNQQRTKVEWTIKRLQTDLKAELIRLNNEYLAGQPETLATIEVEDTPIRERRAVDTIRATGLGRNKIFVSYSHRDGKLFEEFKTMLAPAIQRGLVDLWDDRKILPGQKWKEEIEKALTSAAVAVLLVSQNFLASHFIVEKELPPLLKAAREEGVSIFWIYLSSCLFEQTEIASYQAAHETSRPLDRLSKSQRQAVLSEICAKLVRTAQQGGPPVEPGSTEQLAITLDADFDFIGGEEGAKTAAYRFLTWASKGKIFNVVLRCEALGIADGIVKGLESKSQRSSDEELLLRHASKVQDHCQESGRLFEQALDFIWNHSHFKKDLCLRDEDALGELIVGLRDLIFAHGPVLPGRTTTPEWFKLASQRSKELFAWHVDKPGNHLVVGFAREDTEAMEAYYRQWTGRTFSDHSACHAYGLNIGALRRALVPSISVDLAKRFRTDEAAYLEDLSQLQHWLVARSKPDKVFNIFTWEEMTRLQSPKDRPID